MLQGQYLQQISQEIQFPWPLALALLCSEPENGAMKLHILDILSYKFSQELCGLVHNDS